MIISKRTCRHTDGPFHDCDYVTLRNKLIPIAEKLTNEKCDSTDTISWDKYFLMTMNDLFEDVKKNQALLREFYAASEGGRA